MQESEIIPNNMLSAYSVPQSMTVKDILRQLQLEEKIFVVLMNGKRVKLDDQIERGSEIIILPKIAGGN